MGLNKKDGKKFIQLCLKMTYIFSDCYLTSTGYILSEDIEKPFMIQIDNSQVELFKSFIGEFKILRIFDTKEFKKYAEKYQDLDACETMEDKEKQVIKLISDSKIECLLPLKLFNFITNEPIKSVDEEMYNKVKSVIRQYMSRYTQVIISRVTTEKISNKLTNYITEINSLIDWERFILSDDDADNEKLILSLFKNNDYISFSPKHNNDGPDIIITKSLLPLVNEKNYTQLCYATKKIDSSLYMIVFDFEFELFRLFMIHHYVPMS